ncbi:MAG: DUF3810 family protein [Trueperaceae bacterium]
MPRPHPTASRSPRRPAPTAALVVAAFAAAVWGLLRLAPASWIDGAWVHGVLPALTHAARPVLASVPGSLTGATIVLVLVGLGVAAARRGAAARWALLLAVAAVAGASFEAAWAVGYRRTPLEARLGLPEGAPTQADLEAATERLIAIATEAAPVDPASVDRDASWPTPSWTSAAACVAAADAVVSERRTPLALADTVRRLPAGTMLSGGFSGFVGPWWREPHLDGGLPPAAARATALHELAHAAGWAREAETDALGVLAGLRCDAAELRFAAAVHALGLLRAERARFAAGAPDEALEQRLAALPEAVGRAAAAARDATAAYARPAVGRAAGATYDAYLRAQGVDAGLADYGRAGVLVAAALARCDRTANAPLCPPSRF